MKRPWMPIYWGDYLADTAHFTVEEHGAYLLLIGFYWTNGGLPQDEDAIRRIAKCSPHQWKKISPVIFSKFLAGWKHKRVDEELAKSLEKSQVNSANAKRRHSDRTANAQRSDTQSQPQSQRTTEEAKASSVVARAAKRGARISSDWYPSGADLKFATDLGLRLFEIDNEAAKFLDHYRARADQRAVSRDWSATWRNWCRRAIEQRKPNGGSHGRQLQDDRLSVGKAAERLMAATPADVRAPPRPSLVSSPSETDRRLLPKG